MQYGFMHRIYEYGFFVHVINSWMTPLNYRKVFVSLKRCIQCNKAVSFHLYRPYLPKPTRQDSKTDSPSIKRHTILSDSGTVPTQPPTQVKRASTGSLTLQLTPAQPELIIHAGAVMSIFHLLPAIGSNNYQVRTHYRHIIYIFLANGHR